MDPFFLPVHPPFLPFPDTSVVSFGRFLSLLLLFLYYARRWPQCDQARCAFFLVHFCLPSLAFRLNSVFLSAQACVIPHISTSLCDVGLSASPPRFPLFPLCAFFSSTPSCWPCGTGLDPDLFGQRLLFFFSGFVIVHEVGVRYPLCSICRTPV